MFNDIYDTYNYSIHGFYKATFTYRLGAPEFRSMMEQKSGEINGEHLRKSQRLMAGKIHGELTEIFEWDTDGRREQL